MMKRNPIHPGIFLKDELEEIGISAGELAGQLDVPVYHVTQLIDGQRSITDDTALRLGRFFDMNPQFWLNLQQLYDLRIAEIEAADT